MKRRLIKYLIPFFILALMGADIVSSFAEKKSSILTTPQGLLLLPVSLDTAPGLNYFDEANPTEEYLINKFDYETWAYGLSPHLATVIIFQITAFFIFLFSRARRLESAYLIFSFFLSFYFLFFLDFVSEHKYKYCFHFISLFINLPFVYLFRSFFSLESRGRHYWVAFFFLLLTGLIILPDSIAEEKLFFKILGLGHLATMIYCIKIWIDDVRHPSKTALIKVPYIRWVLAATTLLSLALPVSGFFVIPYLGFEINITKNSLFFLPSVFPIILFVLSLRFDIFYFEVPIFGWFVRAMYFVFFTFVYWFSIGFHVSQIQKNDQGYLTHLALALAFLILVDPLRTISHLLVNRFFINKKQALRQYVAETAVSVTNPRQINSFFNNLAVTLQQGLNAYGLKVIFSDALFKDWKIENSSVAFLTPEDSLWQQATMKRRAVQYPAFTQTVGGRIREILLQHNGFVLMLFQKFDVAVVVSEKKDSRPYLYEDIRFLRSVLRLSEPLLENYRFLIANVQLRRQEKELELAARLQKRIIPGRYASNGIEYNTFVRAAQVVTGDYNDFLPVAKNSFCAFLGDVSGHGLASAYIMAILRSIIRGFLLTAKARMHRVFEQLNEYLSEEYKGSDFMTLFGLKIDLDDDYTSISYINAGQHPAVVYLKDSKQIVKLGDSQRVLGVMATEYKETVWTTKEPFRLFLYSDGAFEVFDDNGEILGEEELLRWIDHSIDMKPDEQLSFLKDKILSSSTKTEELDDLSFALIDI